MSTSSPAPDRGGTDRSSAARPIVRALIGPARRPLNPLIRRLAGRRRLRFFALVRHRGRRSGRLYATPVNARRTPDGFVIGLTFGEGADWVRNLRAAGGGVIRWNGLEYPVGAPELVDWATARPAFSRIERALVPVIGIQRFARVRFAPAATQDGTAPLAPSVSPARDSLPL